MQQQEPTPFNPQPAEAATDIDSAPPTTEDDLRIPPVDLLLVLLLVVVSVATLAMLITLS